MNLSYFRLAIQVLRSNPFFTGVSLFGISFTLAVLMLSIAWLQNQFGNNAPLGEAKKLVYFNQLQQKWIENDTIWSIDSTLVEGKWSIDSTFKTVDNNVMTSQSAFDVDFLRQYFSKEKMTSIEKLSIMDYGSQYNLFHQNRKILINAQHVDENYFEIFNFVLIEGRLLNKGDINQGALNLVITDDLAKKYFGNFNNIIGKNMTIDHKDFTIIGIVKKANINNEYINGDVFLPINHIDFSKYKNGYFGIFKAVALSKSTDTEMVLEEIKYITSSIPFLDPSQSDGNKFNFMKIVAFDHNQYNANGFFYSEDPKESVRQFTLTVILLLGFFILIPLLNLVNLNVSRIMDRSAEIGVRKAFGAQKNHILTQIVFENVILTLIGGVIGLFIAIWLIYLINTNQWLDDLKLQINSTVFLISLGVTLIFGILSGYFPARRMSHVPIVQSLKS